MTALDVKARATALRLLKKYGKPCAIYQIGEGAYNPATGDVASEAIVAQTPYAMIEDYNGLDYISGLIQATDRKITIPAEGSYEPSPNDQVIFDGISYKVISVSVVWSGEKAALYIMQVRK